MQTLRQKERGEQNCVYFEKGNLKGGLEIIHVGHVTGSYGRQVTKCLSVVEGT